MPARQTPYARVLFISPSDSGLDVTPEIDALSDLGFSARPLQGEVTPDRVFQAVRSAKYAILHFACHSGPDGVRLSHGVMFDTDSILQVARMADVRLIFLNGCDNSVAGQALVDEGMPAVICAMRDIPDNLAKQTAQAFYKHLAESGDPHEAYRLSKPASRGMYQWLSNGGYQEFLIGPIMKKLDEFAAVVDQNSADHQRFAAMCDSFEDVRQWYTMASIATVVVVVVISLAFQFIGRAP